VSLTRGRPVVAMLGALEDDALGQDPQQADVVVEVVRGHEADEVVVDQRPHPSIQMR
jgi:hypothetical protein